ncbi:MAG TPA: hypothetical protein VFD97_03985, partial [Acidimicrobiia bacterium]|nr:hypothetical protein [Acidimicrobiia bacterium]
MSETQRVSSFASSAAFTVERVVAPVEGMHRVIAGRWINPLGSIGVPVRTAHEAITAAVYGSIRLGGSFVGAGLGLTNVIGSGTADSFQALVNGLWGDALGRRRDRLEIPMGIRDRDGSPTAVGPELVAAFPAATGRIVVLVHGLFETERCWLGTEEEQGLTRVLEDHPSLTPVPIRYNSGLRVSDNGERLASLLEDVHAEWPVPVQSIALVGHSMGGLVIRSACEAARTAGHRWIDDLEDI